MQKKIWQQCGSPSEYNARWEEFGEMVGWKKKGVLGVNNEWNSLSELTFNSLSPNGHLPIAGNYRQQEGLSSIRGIGVLGFRASGWFLVRFDILEALFSRPDL